MVDKWRIERREKSGGVWGNWSIIELEIEVAAVDNQFSYEDSGGLVADVIYHYRIKHLGDDSYWMESDEVVYTIPAGGSEAGVLVKAESGGGKFLSGGSEAGVLVKAESAGVRLHSGGSEAGVLVKAESGGGKFLSGGSMASLIVYPLGGGRLYLIHPYHPFLAEDISEEFCAIVLGSDFNIEALSESFIAEEMPSSFYVEEVG